MALWKRVPTRRAAVARHVPEVLESMRAEYRAASTAAVKAYPHLAERVLTRTAELESILERYEISPPPGIWQDTVGAFSPNVEASLLSMQWRFLWAPKGAAFLTGDNPVFYFEHEGIGRAESELTLPLSSGVAFWANRRAELPLGHADTTSGAVRQINHRTAYNAERFVYSAENPYWTQEFVRKNRYTLARLA